MRTRRAAIRPFSEIAPVLPVRNVAATIAWYCEILGCEKGYGLPPDSGAVTHGNIVIQFTRHDSFEGSNYPGCLYIHVVDGVAALAREVEKRGLTLSDPIRTIDGMREFELADCNGYRLRFGQHDW